MKIRQKAGFNALFTSVSLSVTVQSTQSINR